jgi:hypothetical protein
MSAEDADHRLTPAQLDQRSDRIQLEHRRGTSMPAPPPAVEPPMRGIDDAHLQRDLVRRSLYRCPNQT